MEYPGIGVIALESPPGEWMPFMRRKMRTLMRSFSSCQDNVVYRLALLDEVQKSVDRLPVEVRKQAQKDRTANWNWYMMCDRKEDFITEKQYLDAWMKRIYASNEERRKQIERLNEVVTTYFHMTDLNSDGHVDFDEFVSGINNMSQETLKSLFKSVDLNGDGVISLGELQYTVARHHFCSGPDDPFSNFYGPIPDV